MSENMWVVKLDRIDVGERVIARSDDKAAARQLYKGTLRNILGLPDINSTMLRSLSLVELEEVDEFLIDGGVVLSQFTWHRSAEAEYRRTDYFCTVCGKKDLDHSWAPCPGGEWSSD